MRSQNRSSQDNSNIIQKIFPISLNSATTAAPDHLTLHNLTVSLSYFRRAYEKMQLGAGAGHMHRFLPAVHCSQCLCCSGSLGHQTPDTRHHAASAASPPACCRLFHPDMQCCTHILHAARLVNHSTTIFTPPMSPTVSLLHMSLGPWVTKNKITKIYFPIFVYTPCY